MLSLHTETGIPDHVAHLYELSFPPEERRLLPAQQCLLDKGALCLSTITKAGTFAGFIFYWQLTDFIFIEHFAIEPGQRGGGIGRNVIRLLEEQHPYIVLEVEPPQTADAIRRIHFYEQLGFTAYPYTYLQPPYLAGGEALPMWLMQKGMSPEEHTFSKIRTEIYCEAYGLM